MTNKTKLLPCPFCGTQPALPDGDGTQYEISCEDCGGAVASVQICDLMTLEERASDSFEDYRYGEEFVERAKLEAIGKWNTRAAPAEDVRAVVDEPVAYADMKRYLHTPTYRRAILLPERKQKTELGIYRLEDEGWNACLDAVEELNK